MIKLTEYENNYFMYDSNTKNHYKMEYPDYMFAKMILENESQDNICCVLGLDKKIYEKKYNDLKSLGFFETSKYFKNKWNKIYIWKYNTMNWKKNNSTIIFEKLVKTLSLLSVIYLICTLFFSSRIYEEISTIFNNVNIVEIAVYLFLAQFIVTCVHELSHAVFTINKNIMVPEIGILIYFLYPSGYADISQIYTLRKKNDKIDCLLAGLMINVICLGISLFIFNLGILKIISAAIFLSNALTIFFNLGFFIKLDGYYILQILISEERLREKSINFIINRNERPKYISLENRLVYIVVGIISIVYIPILVINIVFNFLL